MEYFAFQRYCSNGLSERLGIIRTMASELVLGNLSKTGFFPTAEDSVSHKRCVGDGETPGNRSRPSLCDLSFRVLPHSLGVSRFQTVLFMLTQLGKCFQMTDVSQGHISKFSSLCFTVRRCPRETNKKSRHQSSYNKY